MKMFKSIAMGMTLVAGLGLAACGKPAEEPVVDVPEPAVLEQPTDLPVVEPTVEEAPMATADLVDTLAADGRFTVLTGAIARVGLTDTLKGAGPFTLFAPTDEAFAKLADGTLEGLTDEELMNVLLNHVVAGMVSADAVMTMDGMPVTTMNPDGGATVFVDGDSVMIGDAKVVEADVMATNGIIHVIDNVLVPAMPDAATDADAMGDEATGDDAMTASEAMTDTATMPMTTTNTAP